MEQLRFTATQKGGDSLDSAALPIRIKVVTETTVGPDSFLQTCKILKKNFHFRAIRGTCGARHSKPLRRISAHSAAAHIRRRLANHNHNKGYGAVLKEVHLMV